MVYHTALKQAKFAAEDRLIPDSMSAWRVWRFKQGELMTYQQAGRIAVIKRILGWVIFIPAVLSTLISVLKFMYEHSEKKPGIDAVMMDFAHLMIEMVRFNTPFLNFFWYNSPLPEFKHALNIGFWIIYVLVFVGMALQASGARMAARRSFYAKGWRIS